MIKECEMEICIYTQKKIVFFAFHCTLLQLEANGQEGVNTKIADTMNLKI